MDGAGHHVERYVRDTFGLDEIGLRREGELSLACSVPRPLNAGDMLSTRAIKLPMTLAHRVRGPLGRCFPGPAAGARQKRCATRHLDFGEMSPKGQRLDWRYLQSLGRGCWSGVYQRRRPDAERHSC